ncbi:MAG: FeS-binding protein, partial [Desulfovibrio sp.]|nr:FeS-binding protein [Desulfovibrio sp.]
GADQRALPVPGGRHFKEAFIASAIAEADLLVSINHLKGHELAGFGGALKNIGMGAASKQGKMHQHVTTGPRVDTAACKGCGACVGICAAQALALVDGLDGGRHVLLDLEACRGCGACFLACKTGGLSIDWQTDVQGFLERMMEYAAALLLSRARPSLHVTFVTAVTPDCDCMGFSDAPICPDIGVLASLDVAIDQAGIDLVNQAEPLWPSHLPAGLKAGQNKFLALRPQLPPAMGLDYAEALGLGSRTYELVAV